MTWSVAAVRDQLLELGVRPGGALLVHTAFSRVRPVEGGPAGLIQALRDALGPAGTLVMPTMTDGAEVFDPTRTPTYEMGITAETFWRSPGVTRSTHPGASFAAEGPLAEELCAPQPLSPPHGPDSPVGRVHARGGQVLLLGVQHSESTTVHLAEALAGVPYSVAHPCVVLVDGAPQEVLIPETDHCCEGFRQLDGWLRQAGLQREGQVGNADARLSEARDVVSVAVERLTHAPLTFLCATGAGCEECDAARASAHRRRAGPLRQ
ncbi:MAG: AAC(3) family N-acetyltransferase [Myxococcales bacterium]|nr:AAC(3) family N-acetyltransferase [Myxococcales bacterium]